MGKNEERNKIWGESAKEGEKKSDEKGGKSHIQRELKKLKTIGNYLQKSRKYQTMIIAEM